MDNLLQDINKTKDIFFWTMFQKIDMNDVNITIMTKYMFFLKK